MRRALRVIGCFLVVACSVGLFSCARVLKKQAPLKPEAPTLTVEEQEEKSRQAFENLLVMTTTGTRHEILPAVEQAYLDIVKNYPDTSLAQESYWRLIILNLDDYYPPKPDVAERYYKEYLEKYKHPSYKYAVDDSLARFYYKEKKWQKLLDMCAPYIKEYINTGRVITPLYIFFYAEAKFFMGDFVEANKGYRTLMRLFPSSHEAKISERRLDEILSNY